MPSGDIFGVVRRIIELRGQFGIRAIVFEFDIQAQTAAADRDRFLQRGNARSGKFFRKPAPDIEWIQLDEVR